MKKLLTLSILIFGFIACEELEPVADKGVAIQSGSIDVTDFVATANGRVISSGDGIEQYGHVWSTTELDPIYTQGATQATRLLTGGNILQSDSLDYISQIDLETGKVYKIRAYAVDTYGSPPYYGADESIATADATMADFTVTNDNCFAPCEVSFTDASTNASSWSWSFGDGQTSDLPNPFNTYQKPGTYTVSLEVSGSGGTHSTEKVVVVNGRKFEKTIDLAATGVADLLMDMPIVAHTDGSYFIGVNAFSLSQEIMEIFKYSETGELDQTFSYTQAVNHSDAVCTIIPYLTEYNTDIIGVKDVCEYCTDGSIQISNETGETSDFIFHGYSPRFYQQTCIKIIPKTQEVLNFHYRVCMGRQNDTDPDEQRIYLIQDSNVPVGFYCDTDYGIGHNETPKDAILTESDDILVVGLKNDLELIIGVQDVSDYYNPGLFISDTGIPYIDPVRVMPDNNGNYLVIGNFIDEGLSVITLDAGYGVASTFSTSIPGLTIRDALVLDDGSIIIVGKNNGPFMAKFSADGSNYIMDWMQSDFSAAELLNIAAAQDGGFIMSGGSGSTPYIIKTDSEGNTN